MGYFMARNLANHRATHLEYQLPLLVWNRSKDKSKTLSNELSDWRVAISPTVANVAIKCDIIISLLSSDDVIKSAFKDLVAALQARISHVCLTL